MSDWKTDSVQEGAAAESAPVVHSFDTAPDFTADLAQKFMHAGDAPALTVKDMDADCQPREKARRYGIASLTNAELFAVILRTGTPGYPVTELCRDLMQRHENLICNLNRTTPEQLMEVRGIGELKAMQIMAVLTLIQRYTREKVGDRVSIGSSADIFALMKDVIGNLPHEEMWALFINRANRVIGKMQASVGGAAATVFDAKKILRAAILAHADGVILCHNHPSGTTRPSGPDDTITSRFAQACRQVELRCLDHLIITSDSYYSYCDNGRL